MLSPPLPRTQQTAGHQAVLGRDREWCKLLSSQHCVKDGDQPHGLGQLTLADVGCQFRRAGRANVDVVVGVRDGGAGGPGQLGAVIEPPDKGVGIEQEPAGPDASASS